MNRRSLSGATAAVIIVGLVLAAALGLYFLNVKPLSPTTPPPTGGAVTAYQWTVTQSGIFALNGTTYSPSGASVTFYHSNGQHLSQSSSLYNTGGGVAISSSTAFQVAGSDNGFIYVVINPGTVAFLDVPMLLKNPGFASTGYWIPVGASSVYQFAVELTPTQYVGSEPSTTGGFPTLGSSQLSIPYIHDGSAVAAISSPADQTSTSGSDISIKWQVSGIVKADGVVLAGLRFTSNQTTNYITFQSVQLGGNVYPVYNAPPGAVANANGFYTGGGWNTFSPYAFSSGGVPQGWTVVSTINQFGFGTLFGAPISGGTIDFVTNLHIGAISGAVTVVIYIDLITPSNGITTLSDSVTLS